MTQRDLDQVDREQRGERAEGEGAEQAVAEGLLLLLPRQAEDHDGEDQRVVRAEQPFEHDQQADRDEIAQLDVHAMSASETLTRFVSRPIFGSTQGCHGRTDLYFISMAARLLDMHPQTLRKYERLGLVRPTRTIGSMRVYSSDELERLRLIKHLVDEAGINLAGVQRLLSIAEVGAAHSPADETRRAAATRGRGRRIERIGDRRS